MSAEFDREGLVSIFLSEAEDSLTRLWSALHPPDQEMPTPDAINDQYIVAHTLKGTSSLYGYRGLSGLTEILETLVEKIHDTAQLRWPETVAMLRDLVATIRTQVQHIKEYGSEAPTCYQDWTARFPTIPLNADVLVDAPADESSVVLSEEYLVPNLDSEVASYFSPEAQEYLETIEAALLRLEKYPDDVDILQQLFRTTHTLKGSAHTVGFKSIGDLIHHVEDFVGAVREGRTKVTPELTDVIFRVVDVVKLLMRRDSRSVEHTRHEFADVIRRLTQLRSSVLPQSLDETSPNPIHAADPNAHAETEPHRESEARKESDSKPGDEKDNAVIRVSRGRLERLLNLVGELVISRGRLEQRLAALEQLSDQVLMFKGRMLEAVRTFEEKHAFTLPSASPNQGTVTSQGQPQLADLPGLTDFGALEFDRYDDFNILARRLAELSADVGESMAQLNGSIRKAREDMGLLQRLSLGMRDEIARARMVPIGTPFVRFQRAVREMAKLTGKQVALVTSGEHTEVDTNVVERLVDPLIHLVRNAVYHGIEPADVRLSQGKPAVGTVYINASHRGSSVVIEVEDDGGGLNIAKIKAKAVTLGLIRPESVSTVSDAEAIKMIFLPGFSTADVVGDVAGRGVGMDVVKDTLESINGQIEVETELGVGTKFTLRLPLTLLISMALLVRTGNQRYALPLPNIREVVMPVAGSVQDVGGHPVLHIGDEAIDVLSLSHILGVESSAKLDASPIIIIRTATGMQGIGVDELLGRQEIVIKALGTLKPFKESSFVGATIDPEGRVILVLDIARVLAGRARNSLGVPTLGAMPLLAGPSLSNPNSDSASDQSVGAAHGGMRLLLIDDSLSIRKFVGKMLQGAGYDVETAVDGEEGLRKATAGGYRLIITDLEMPKLNGYEVIQALRDRPQTKSTPILVMTTRAGEKHRQMALSVGASGYIAKPVEERTLIQEVGRWAGQATGAKTQ
jgi:chemosensory pili system protein ChpA (sensor histidine kinase/response regulator)